MIRYGQFSRFAVAAVAVLLAGVTNAPSPHPATANALRPGGQFLTFEASSRKPGPLLERHRVEADVHPGRDLFYRDWLVEAHNDEPLAGPDFDAATCSACHIETALHRWTDADSFIRWIAKPAIGAHTERYGTQINLRHRADSPAEAELFVVSVPREFVYPDGTARTLSFPVGVARARDGEWIPVRLRTAPLLFGWGLLEIADPEMLAHFHDPEDRNGDGVSGRMVPAPDEGLPQRLGWKNSQTTLESQIAAALANDMGVTSRRACGPDCREEILETELQALADYVRGLGVPDRRHRRDPAGQHFFGLAGCSECHVSALITGDHPNDHLANQLVWPYSDLLLHDMGPLLAETGDAADAREWRTAPLWGIGIVEERYPERGFLHDGRARSIEEAILWHGGEAAAARDNFTNLSKSQRDALLDFVRSL